MIVQRVKVLRLPEPQSWAERAIPVLDRVIMRASVIAFLAGILLAVVEIDEGIRKFEDRLDAAQSLDKQLSEMMQPIAIETKKGK